MTGEKPGMPFVIRLYLGAGSREMKIVHTFLFDGNEEKDYLKGMGTRSAKERSSFSGIIFSSN